MPTDGVVGCLAGDRQLAFVSCGAGSSIQAASRHVHPSLQDDRAYRGRAALTCEGVGGVQGALTLFYGGVAQAFHDDRVVELKEQLVVEKVDGEGQDGKVKEEGRGRIKESAP